MTAVTLTEGIIKILRENISGWATGSDNIKQVFPEHPPEDLSPDKYPRAAVDITGMDNDEVNVTVDKFIEDFIVEVTVYATDSKEMNQKFSDSRTALITHSDGTDSGGSAYLPNSYLQRPRFIGPTFEENIGKNVTRYNRSFEFEYKTLSESG